MNLKLLKGPFLPLILLVGFYFLWSANLVRFTLQAVDYDPRGDLGLFQSESAFQYRYARLAASGKPIPDFDLAAQWPEGLKTRQVIHTLMDRAAGGIYRAIIPKNIPLHLYIFYFVAYFSTLSIFPLFFLSWGLGKNPWIAFFSAAAYAMSYATFGRSLGGYLHENFALPFLFLFLASFYWAVNQFRPAGNYSKIRPWLGLTLAGASLWVALASWHLSQFFFTAFTASLLLAALWYWKKIKAVEEAKNLLMGFFALLPFLLLAGLVLPTLRYQGFLSSPLMVFCLGLFAVWGTSKIKGKIKLILWGLILVGTGTALFFSSRHWGEYSHVYDLLYYKLRFMGQKPSDPSLLSYQARVFWTAGFDTPTFKDLAWHYNLLLPLGLGGVVLYLARNRGKKETPGILALALLTMIFLILSLLLLRMGVFLTFLLALFLPYWWGEKELKAKESGVWSQESKTPQIKTLFSKTPDSPLSTRPLLKWIGALSLAAILGFQLFFAVAFKFDKQTRQENLLLPWITRHAAPQEPFLTAFEFGPSVLTYTGRPVVLHSMFEEQGIREKNRQFLEALYGSEEDFYRFCRQVGARYFLYQSFLLLDTSADSNRYVAAKMKLIPQSAAFLLHFQEDQLKYFQLVFQEGPFRLYKIKEEVPSIGQEKLTLYSPFFNPLLFDLSPGSSGIEPARIQKGLKQITEFQAQVKLADDFLKKKIYNISLFHLARAEKLDPQSPVPHYLRAHLYLQQSQRDSAKAELKRALDKNPQYIYAQDLLRNLP